MKITPNDYIEVFRKYNEGYSLTDIVYMMNISISIVTKILNKKYLTKHVSLVMDKNIYDNLQINQINEGKRRRNLPKIRSVKVTHEIKKHHITNLDEITLLFEKIDERNKILRDNIEYTIKNEMEEINE